MLEPIAMLRINQRDDEPGGRDKPNDDVLPKSLSVFRLEFEHTARCFSCHIGSQLCHRVCNCIEQSHGD